MKTRFVTICCVVVAICLGGGSAFGQDFGALLKAIERFETNLKQLVEQESVNQVRIWKRYKL